MSCPSSQYLVASNHSCLMCSALCNTCDTSSTNCTSCALVNLLTPVYFFNYTCVETCPNGYFANDANTTNRLCSKCSFSCTRCSGSATNCSACGNTTTAVYYKDANYNVCQNSCNLQQYFNPSVPNTCSNCDNSCTQCKNSSTNCQSCVSSYYLYAAASQCLSVCPQSFYNNPNLDTVAMSYVCSACSSECLTCYGPTSQNCTSCTNIVSSLG